MTFRPPIILLGLVILACAFYRSPHRIKPAWFPHLKGWQKLFGVLAAIVVVLMVFNPEFLALGLLGDTAFLDLFVLLLSLQLQTVTARVWHSMRALFSSMMRVMIPRLNLSFSMFILIFAPVADVVVTIHKAVHRITS